ncbi:hypothetical protein CA13_21200 [Planctomycetes bacterium CA13]|uniref:Uncharacterized protein n=1 Tax=Novipirellula herctigrandis TaxID=2527986 RepID=A0A5C5Z047_9BACT|nr:hypothetical protein CA13_21200 [Planctomycetes bacterium CA13]
MTQLMLFDSPVSVTSPAVSFTTGIVPASGRTPVAATSAAATSAAATSAAATSAVMPTPRVEEPPQGLNHMGDLARLVLMRYDMVAQRRAAQGQRRAVQGQRRAK